MEPDNNNREGTSHTPYPVASTSALLQSFQLHLFAICRFSSWIRRMDGAADSKLETIPVRCPLGKCRRTQCPPTPGRVVNPQATRQHKPIWGNWLDRPP